MQFEQTGNKRLPYEVIVEPHEAEVVSEVYGIINLERSAKGYEDLATKGIWRALSESARKKEPVSLPCKGLEYTLEIADVLQVFSELAPQRKEAIKNMSNRRQRTQEYADRNDRLGRLAGDYALNLLTAVTNTLTEEIIDKTNTSNIREFPPSVEIPTEGLMVPETGHAAVTYLDDRRAVAV